MKCHWMSGTASADVVLMKPPASARLVVSSPRRFVAYCHSPLSARPMKLGCSEMPTRSEEHTSELQSLMRISYAVFCLKKKKTQTEQPTRKNRSLNHSNSSHTRINTSTT